MSPDHSKQNRSRGPVHISKIIPKVLKGIGISVHQRVSTQCIGDILDLLANKDFNMLDSENKLNIAATFSQIDLCGDCKEAYFSAVKEKLDPTKGNKPHEYFVGLQYNVEQIREFNKKNEESYRVKEIQRSFCRK